MASDRSPALEHVVENATESAKDGDAFAVCCSDGDYQFARTSDAALDLLSEMRAMREYLSGERVEYEYDVAVLHTEYEYSGLWDCDVCGEEFLVETKLDPLGHVFVCGNDGGTTRERRH